MRHQPLAIVLAMCVLARGAFAETPTSQPEETAGWRIAIDNDLFASSTTDRDYTGGLSVTLTGRQATDWPISLDPVLNWIDPIVPRETVQQGAENGQQGAMLESPLRALQIGVIAFTPQNLRSSEPLHDDRPYASLVYASNSRTYVSNQARTVYDTSFAFGFLGLDVAAAVQRAVHEATQSDKRAAGWENQISDGGEPTFRVTFARQSLLATSSHDDGLGADLKWRAEVSAGYLTEANVAVTARWGILNTPWWSMSPERADYMMQPVPVMGPLSPGGRRELYVWAGAKARVRAYNALLQGQFRDSAVELPASQLETLIGEAWFGVTWQISRNYWLSHVSHYQSSEIKTGRANRDLVWAGLILTHNF